MEWEGSSDCVDEIKTFNDCMVRERRRFQWSENKPGSMYDYIQERLEERRKEKKFTELFTKEEIEAIKVLEAEDKEAQRVGK